MYVQSRIDRRRELTEAARTRHAEQANRTQALARDALQRNTDMRNVSNRLLM